MTRALVTHADEPIGRRIVRALCRDADVDAVLAVGDGPLPRAFDALLSASAPRVTYARVDLAKHRAVRDLFRSESFQESAIDTVVYVPRHAVATTARPAAPAGLSERTAETRLLLQNCLETPAVRHLVALGSAFVYRLPPGNANRLDEDSELDFDPEAAPEIRSWIDCDMMLHAEVHSDRLRVVLLRLPTVVADGGYVYLNPVLAGRPGLRMRALGFDPICALVSDRDAARAVMAAIASDGSGIYNIAGNEALPLSVLGHWTRRETLPVPSPLLPALAAGARLLGIEAGSHGQAGPHLQYGFTLDTQRARRDLSFRPVDRIGLTRAGDGALALETITSV